MSKIRVLNKILRFPRIFLGIKFYQKFTKSGTYDNYDALAVVVGGLIVYLGHIL